MISNYSNPLTKENNSQNNKKIPNENNSLNYKKLDKNNLSKTKTGFIHDKLKNKDENNLMSSNENKINN